MSGIRKRSLQKKSNRPTTSSTNSEINVTNFQQQCQIIKQLTTQIQSLSLENIHKTVIDNIGILLQNKNSVLISQRLLGYKQCFNLIGRYISYLKIKGHDISSQETIITWSVFGGVVDQVNSLSQQQRHDAIIDNVNLTGSIMMVLEGTVKTIEIESLKKQKKPILMRKNSLKKVEELPTLRPSSRGKLSSLSKKQFTSKRQLLNITQQRSQLKTPQTKSENTSVQNTVYKLFCIIKNISANKIARKSLLKEEYLRLLNRYLSIWDDKNSSTYGNTLMVQIVAAYRHIAADDKSYQLFMLSNCIQVWCKIIQMFPTSQDLVFNILRILSKVSSYPQCSEKLNDRKGCLKTLCSFFKVYRSSIHIIIRVSFIFANLTSFLTDIRSQVYFQLKVWDDIFGCFIHYAQSELKGKSQVEKMGISMAAWDYQAMKKQSDIDALIKIIRLIANLFTVSAIGQDIYMNDSKSYKEIVVKLKYLLQKKSISENGDLIACILSCLTNVFYYDKQLLLSSLEYKQAKIGLIGILVNFVVQIDNEEICCESLRVLSNITRMKEYVKAVLDAKIHEAVIILLDSTSKQIVYYSLGTIINLLADQEFKTQYKNQIAGGVIQILKECESQDFDLVSVSLKVLSSIMGDSLDPTIMAAIETCLVNLGSHCDRIIMNDIKKGDNSSAQESRALINVLLNNMPEQKYICPVKSNFECMIDCGRKFADEKKLNEHVSRRHKAS